VKIHKEGFTIILTVVSFFMILYVIVAQTSIFNSLIFNSIVALGFLCTCFTLLFFRNPSRTAISDINKILAPADGKIVAIEEVIENEYLKCKCMKVSIFMSIWNIHVNRYPVSGYVSYAKYHPGNYFIASYPKSSDLNEHQTVAIKTIKGTEIMVKQIAGAVARRIVCYAVVNEFVTQGSDLGFIKFGSRVDLFLPLNAGICVKMNEKVKGNKTVIAQINN
jgi:phosphatidylserine decarboxylase